MTHARTLTITLAALLVCVAAAASAAPRGSGLPETPRVLRYEMRTSGTLIGQPELRMGPVETLAGDRRARSVTSLCALRNSVVLRRLICNDVIYIHISVLIRTTPITR